MIVLNVTLIVCLFACFAYILKLRYVKLHTRERFGWFIVTAATTMVSPYLFQGGLQVKIKTGIKTRIFNITADITIGQLSIEDKIISFVLIAMVIWFMYGLFINWDKKQRDDDKK